MAKNLTGYNALNELEKNGTIKNYHYLALDQNGNLGLGEKNNSEMLVITFNNGDILTIQTSHIVKDSSEMTLKLNPQDDFPIELSQDAGGCYIDLQKRLAENVIAQQGKDWCKESHVGD